MLRESSPLGEAEKGLIRCWLGVVACWLSAWPSPLALAAARPRRAAPPCQTRLPGAVLPHMGVCSSASLTFPSARWRRLAVFGAASVLPCMGLADSEERRDAVGLEAWLPSGSCKLGKTFNQGGITALTPNPASAAHRLGRLSPKQAARLLHFLNTSNKQ